MVFRFLLGKDSNTTKTTTITKQSACMQAKEFARNLEAEDEQEEWELTNNVPKMLLEPKIQKIYGKETPERNPSNTVHTKTTTTTTISPAALDLHGDRGAGRKTAMNLEAEDKEEE